MSLIVVEGSKGCGKSSIVRKIEKEFSFVESKSVPEWFRQYLDYAREQEMDIQNAIYNVGHTFTYYRANISQKNYVFDRWKYTTIIRLGYQNALHINKIADEILNLRYNPDIVIIMRASKELAQKRMIKRDNVDYFDSNYYDYENTVFNILANENDALFKVYLNNHMIDDVYTEMRGTIIDTSTLNSGIPRFDRATGILIEHKEDPAQLKVPTHIKEHENKEYILLEAKD